MTRRLLFRWWVRHQLDGLHSWTLRRTPAKWLYWITLQGGVVATTGKYSNTEVPSLTLDELLKRLYAEAYPR